ncbi:hypothetical protein KFQ06_01755 [Serratia entomophila]|uniref:Uncharacterized protein n=1 Tax=Serratia entomophila TaxID=42906 RepID=A0ABY5CTN7_9GAMM|nr:hypothetical protein [Serratia entomophila]USV01294.1 hypothetical protein KFQ06_01755 [Serratia entomophila]
MENKLNQWLAKKSRSISILNFYRDGTFTITAHHLLRKKRVNPDSMNEYMVHALNIWIFSIDIKNSDIILFGTGEYIILYITTLLKLSVDNFPGVTHLQFFPVI